METAKIPVYIRFGEIPKDGKSKIHFGDEIAGTEPGLSVWKAVEANGCYFPILPDNANESAIQDYFDMIFDKENKVYLVTGRELSVTGHDNEPLIFNAKIIKELCPYYKNYYREVE
ncbi:hypothetical protein [uncultured Clostridium sp.]|uniref:hypothetical protein n=1 Tax=uncultured Clostridium sp. TaxID=59620 RepID=UPI002629D20C|nr:hypothetical protein [uncultured Clostridium sp.]